MSYLDRRSHQEQIAINDTVRKERTENPTPEMPEHQKAAERGRQLAAQAMYAEGIDHHVQTPEEAAIEAKQQATLRRARDAEHEERRQKQDDDEVYAQGERSEFADY